MRLIAPFVVALIAGTVSGAEVRYHAVPLVPMVPGGVNEPKGLSDNGIIAGGSSFNVGGGYTAAVVWPYAGAAPTVIGGAPGTASFAVGVNDEGLACGVLGSGVPFVHFEGVTTFLQGANGDDAVFGWPAAINRSGHIAGIAMGAGGSPFEHAIVWNDVSSALSLPVPPGTVYARAIDISDAGQVVGFLVDDELNAHLASWRAGDHAITTFGVPENAGRECTGVNEQGTVIGWLTHDGQWPLVWRAFTWRGGEVELLPVLPPKVTGQLIRALDINDHGVIVGSDGDQALLWPTEQEVVALTSLVLDLPSGQILEEAQAINNNGQIIATGWPNAYLLQPFTCAGDANLDATVNAADLSVVLSRFGTSAAAWDRGDLNGDGHINAADLSVLLGAFSTTCD